VNTNPDFRVFFSLSTIPLVLVYVLPDFHSPNPWKWTDFVVS
jgi:hypothetical protein